MNIVKGVLIFAGGAIVGGFAGFSYARKRFEFTAEDLQKMSDHYSERAPKEEEVIFKNDDEPVKDLEEVVKIVEEKQYVSYNKPEEINRMKDTIERYAEEESPREDYPEEPFVISEEDFAETELSFDKYATSYYLDDGALVDDDCDDILIVDDTIGLDNLENFLKNDQETIYIRNPKLSCDYEVTKTGGSWSSVIGVGGDEY